MSMPIALQTRAAEGASVLVIAVQRLEGGSKVTLAPDATVAQDSEAHANGVPHWAQLSHSAPDVLFLPFEELLLLVRGAQYL